MVATVGRCINLLVPPDFTSGANFKVLLNNGSFEIFVGVIFIYAEKIFLFRGSGFDFFDFCLRGCSTGGSNQVRNEGSDARKAGFVM